MQKGPHQDTEILPAEPSFTPEDVRAGDLLEITLAAGPVQSFTVHNIYLGRFLLKRASAPQELGRIPLTAPSQILDLNDPNRPAFSISRDTLAALIEGGLELAHQKDIPSKVHLSLPNGQAMRGPRRAWSPEDARLLSIEEVRRIAASFGPLPEEPPQLRRGIAHKQASDTAPTTLMPAEAILLLDSDAEQEGSLNEAALRQIPIDLQALTAQAKVGIRHPDQAVIRPAVLRLVAAQHQMPPVARADLEAVIVAFERRSDEVSRAAVRDLRTAFPKASEQPAQAKKRPWWRRFF